MSDESEAIDRQLINGGRDANGRFRPGHRYGFKPGQSGNPAGRAASPFTDELREVAALRARGSNRTYLQRAALKLCELAARGNLQAIAMLSDRLDGRPSKMIQAEGPQYYDWREKAKAEGIPESDVIAEALRIIQEMAEQCDEEVGLSDVESDTRDCLSICPPKTDPTRG